MITEQKNRTVEEVKKAYKHRYDNGIDAFFDMLLKEDWGFITDTPESFPDLDLAWESPLRITNAIIDIGVSSKHNMKSILSQLDELGCQALQIRAYCLVPDRTLDDFLSHTLYSRLKSIELLLQYTERINESSIEKLISTHKRIHGIIVHSSPFDKSYKLEEAWCMVTFSKQTIDSCESCGHISQQYFAINTPLFTEAQKFNTCLNRKISIDVDGNIKNCPSMEKSFGNIKDTSLVSALAKREFKELWEINKDQIEVCKDCEFRYICTDCRAYITDDKNKYSKPSKCSYDPYTATWADITQKSF